MIRADNDSKGSEEGGVSSRVGEGKERTTVAVVTKGIIAVTAGKITLNSLITGVTFEEIVLSGLEASKKTVNDDNLKWGWTVGSNMLITLTT